MPQAAKTSSTSRRAFLAGVAGAALSTPVAIAAVDPVYAAIANYESAAAEHKRALVAADFIKVPPEIEVVVRKACTAECEALENLITTVPTTMAGVKRLLQFQRETLDCDAYALEAAHLSYLCQAVETALQRIA